MKYELELVLAYPDRPVEPMTNHYAKLGVFDTFEEAADEGNSMLDWMSNRFVEVPERRFGQIEVVRGRQRRIDTVNNITERRSAEPEFYLSIYEHDDWKDQLDKAIKAMRDRAEYRRYNKID